MASILPVSDLRNYNDVKLLEKLLEAENVVKDGTGWLTIDELKKMAGE